MKLFEEQDMQPAPGVQGAAEGGTLFLQERNGHPQGQGPRNEVTASAEETDISQTGSQQEGGGRYESNYAARVQREEVWALALVHQTTPRRSSVQCEGGK